jgi:propanol-preferring alcohol dehydrogenase
MKAMVLTEQGAIERSPLTLQERPIPTPQAGEVLVKVSVCAVCRTDLHVIEGDLPPKKLPLIPGHEVVGRVERLGVGCRLLEVGQRVGIAWLRFTCGQCKFCTRGDENLCEQSRYTGYHEDGGYAEYMVVPEAFAYRIPEAFDDVQAAPLLCAGIIGYRALQRSNVPDGGKLGMFGFGSSAHITLQIARARNCEVYVSSRGERHQQLARQLGAAWVGDGQAEIPVKLDSAIIFAPVGTVVPPALRALDKGGTVSIAGIYLTPVPELEYESCLFHEKQLLSVESNTRNDGRSLLAEAARIPVHAETEEFALEQANEALLKLKEDQLRGTAVLRIGDD